MKLTLADVSSIERLILWSVEFGLAVVAVDTLGVVLAVLADTTALVVSVNVEGKMFVVDFLDVIALVRVTKTVTRCSKKKEN